MDKQEIISRMLKQTLLVLKSSVDFKQKIDNADTSGLKLITLIKQFYQGDESVLDNIIQVLSVSCEDNLTEMLMRCIHEELFEKDEEGLWPIFGLKTHDEGEDYECLSYKLFETRKEDSIIDILKRTLASEKIKSLNKNVLLYIEESLSNEIDLERLKEFKMKDLGEHFAESTYEFSLIAFSIFNPAIKTHKIFELIDGKYKSDKEIYEQRKNKECIIHVLLYQNIGFNTKTHNLVKIKKRIFGRAKEINEGNLIIAAANAIFGSNELLCKCVRNEEDKACPIWHLSQIRLRNYEDLDTFKNFFTAATSLLDYVQKMVDFLGIREKITLIDQIQRGNCTILSIANEIVFGGEKNIKDYLLIVTEDRASGFRMEEMLAFNGGKLNYSFGENSKSDYTLKAVVMKNKSEEYMTYLLSHKNFVDMNRWQKIDLKQLIPKNIYLLFYERWIEIPRYSLAKEEQQ